MLILVIYILSEIVIFISWLHLFSFHYVDSYLLKNKQIYIQNLNYLVCSSQMKTISKMINIKPKELQEKQLAKCKNYNKSKINKTKTN